MDLLSIRTKRGLTQKDIADALGVDQSAVHLWEVGKTKPRVDTLVNLAKLLNCSVDDLLAGSQAVQDGAKA